jgi:hypothetical protein
MRILTLVGVALTLSAMGAAVATGEINLGRTSLATVSGTPVNGNVPADDPFHGVLNLFDDGRHLINDLNYDYWLGNNTPAPQWVDVRFAVPVTITQMTLHSSIIDAANLPPSAFAPSTQEVTEPSATRSVSLPPFFNLAPGQDAPQFTFTAYLYGADDKELAVKSLTVSGAAYYHLLMQRSTATVDFGEAPAFAAPPTVATSLPGNIIAFAPAVAGVTRVRLVVPGLGIDMREWQIMGSVPEGTAYTVQLPRITRTAQGCAALAQIACPAWISQFCVEAGIEPTTVDTGTAFVTTYRSALRNLAVINVDKVTGVATFLELAKQQ